MMMKAAIGPAMLVAAALAATPARGADSGSRISGVPVPSRNIVVMVLSPVRTARPLAPVPAVVVLKNYSKKFEGTIEAWTGSRKETSVAARKISIGKGTFRFFLYPPVCDAYNPRLQVAVKDSKGKLCASQSISLQADGGQWWTAAVMGENRRFTREQLPGVRAVVAPMRRVELLPDRWHGYKAFDVLFWDGNVRDELEPAQRQALAEWVQMGGRLVLMAAAGDQDLVSPLPRVVPSLELETVEARPPTFVAGDPRRWVDLGRKARTIFTARKFATDNDMLWVEKPHGMGMVVFLRIPFAELASLRREETVALLGRPGTDTGVRGFQRGDAVLKGWLARSAGYTEMSFMPVLVTILVYILMVSVVDYVVLRKTRRLPWTWATFPCLIGVFSTFSFFAFYQGKLGDHERHELLVHDIGEDGLGRALTMSCVRAVSTKPIEFDVESSHLVMTLGEANDAYSAWRGNRRRRRGTNDEGWITVLGTYGPYRKITIPGHVGSFRFFSEEWPCRVEELPFTGRLYVDGKNGLNGQLEKKTPLEVSHGFIFHRDRMHVFDKSLKISFSQGVKVGGVRNRHQYWRGGRGAEVSKINTLEVLAGWVRGGVGQTASPTDQWQMAPDNTRTWITDGGYRPLAGADEAAVFAFCTEKTKYAGMPVIRVRCIRQIVPVLPGEAR